MRTIVQVCISAIVMSVVFGIGYFQFYLWNEWRHIGFIPKLLVSALTLSLAVLLVVVTVIVLSEVRK